MATKRPKMLSVQDIIGSVSEGLRRAAVRPNISGYKPQPKQTEFHKSTARTRAIFAGNRFGKTVGGAAEGVWRATGTHPYQKTHPTPTQGRVVAVDILQGINKIVLPEVSRWIPPSSLINGSWEDSYSSGLRTLTLVNGSTIEFMSYEMTVEKFAGTSRSWTWFDEEPPEDIYNECLLRLADQKGVNWLTVTPLEGMTWMYDRIFEAAKTDPSIFVITGSTDENIYVSASEIEAILSGMSEDEKKARRHGTFMQLGGLIYKTFTVENVIDPIFNSDLWDIYKRSWQFASGMDAGFHNPTAFLFAAYDPEGRIVVFDEYYVAGETVSNHAGAIRERVGTYMVPMEYFVGDSSIRNTDPLTGTSIQAEYAENGIGIVLGSGDVKAGINRVSSAFEQKKLYITRNCEKLIWELNRYRWQRWKNSKTAADNNLKEEPVKKDDHLCDALRYLVTSRPGFEVGNSSNFQGGSRGYPEAINPEERIDYELLRELEGTVSDDLLGSDW